MTACLAWNHNESNTGELEIISVLWVEIHFWLVLFLLDVNCSTDIFEDVGLQLTLASVALVWHRRDLDDRFLCSVFHLWTSLRSEYVIHRGLIFLFLPWLLLSVQRILCLGRTAQMWACHEVFDFAPCLLKSVEEKHLSFSPIEELIKKKQAGIYLIQNTAKSVILCFFFTKITAFCLNIFKNVIF